MTGYGIALPKGSKYKEMFDKKIIEYSHSGELERTQNFWFSGTCKNQKEESTRNSHQFGLLQSSSVFILLLAGIGFSVISLIASHLFENYVKNGKTKSWFYESKKNSNGVFNMLYSKEQNELDQIKNMVFNIIYN
jgi:ionotropic glutamate receptor NMDA 2B